MSNLCDRCGYAICRCEKKAYSAAEMALALGLPDANPPMETARPQFIVMKLVPNIREPGQVIIAPASSIMLPDIEAGRTELKKCADETPGTVFVLFGTVAILMKPLEVINQ